MNKDNDESVDAAALRCMAEEKLKAMEAKTPPSMTDTDTLELFHELQVYQIELEMQNDELRQAIERGAWLDWYTDLYDFAPVAYFTLDRMGNIRQLNLTAASLLGIERSRLVDSRFGLFVSPETQPAFNECFKSTFESKTKQMCEIVLLPRAGDPIFAQMNAMITSNGEECRIAVTDITKRKQAEEALAQSKEEVARILDSISDAFFSLDRDWRFTYVNNEAEHILRQSREQLIGAKLWDEFPETIGTVFQMKYETAMLDGTAAQFEAYYPAFDRWLEVRVYPYRSGLSVYFQDVSDRHAAQEVLANTAERSARIADVLQQALIPPHIPMQMEGYEIAARYQPALTEAEVCGDFYDLFDLGDGKLGIDIGDIVGKGLHAAARVAAVKHTIRSYAFIDERPSNVMTFVNDALFREVTTESDLLTAFFAVLDTITGIMIYANAGHEPPLVRHSDGSVEYMAIGGRMFDGFGKHIYLEGSLSLQEGDLIVLATDGITEARIAGQWDLFGAEGIERCLSENVNASAEQIAARILEDAISFANGELRDDAAIVVIKKLNRECHE